MYVSASLSSSLNDGLNNDDLQMLVNLMDQDPDFGLSKYYSYRNVCMYWIVFYYYLLFSPAILFLSFIFQTLPPVSQMKNHLSQFPHL